MVSGDICEQPLEPKPCAEVPAAAVLPVRSKEAAVVWPRPVDGAAEDFDEDSD